MNSLNPSSSSSISSGPDTTLLLPKVVECICASIRIVCGDEYADYLEKISSVRLYYLLVYLIILTKQNKTFDIKPVFDFNLKYLRSLDNIGGFSDLLCQGCILENSYLNLKIHITLTTTTTTTTTS